MMGAPSKLDQPWRLTRKSTSNPDHLNYSHLFDKERSEAAGRDVFKSPIVKVIDVSIGLTKSQEKPNGEEMIFLHFANVTRKLGMNSTNCKSMASLTGSLVPRRWIGTTIQLYVDPQAKYPKGEKGPAIRIRPKLPTAPAEAAPLPAVPEADLERLEAEREARLEREPGEEG